MIKVVSIVWEDSRQIPGWKHLDEVEEDICICHSIGQLIKETASAFFITVTTADNAEQVGQVVAIPKSCVKEICEIHTGSNEDKYNLEFNALNYADSVAKANNIPENVKNLLVTAYIAGANRV